MFQKKEEKKEKQIQGEDNFTELFDEVNKLEKLNDEKSSLLNKLYNSDEDDDVKRNNKKSDSKKDSSSDDKNSKNTSGEKKDKNEIIRGNEIIPSKFIILYNLNNR